MSAVSIKRMTAPATAFLTASGVHALIVAGVLWMPGPDIKLPQVVGGFEVVDLSAFGVAAQPEPEPIVEKPVEEAKVEPEPQPEPEPELIPEPEPVKAPAPLPKPQPKPKPKPVVKIQPQPKPQPIQKVQPQPQPKPQPQKTETASPGSQNAFVPPSSTAAYLRNPKPSYPRMALKRGMQGVVVVSVEVSPRGMALAVKIKKSSGYSPLDNAALKAVQAWRFAPATRGGVPVAATVDVPIRFALNDA